MARAFLYSCPLLWYLLASVFEPCQLGSRGCTQGSRRERMRERRVDQQTDSLFVVTAVLEAKNGRVGGPPSPQSRILLSVDLT